MSKWDGKGVGKETIRDFGNPGPAAESSPPPYPGEDAFHDDAATVATLPPFVDVELVYQKGRVGMPTGDWGALEVHSRNRIYVVAWDMRCIAVLDPRTRQPDPNHPLLGTYLSGGQKQDADEMEMTYPWPRPGTEAVFEHRVGPRKGFVSTSTVTRVVLRLRVMTVPRDRAIDTWDTLSSVSRRPDLGEKG